MENKNNDYYDYGDEDEFLCDDNEKYDYTHHDELLDCIMDKLQRYECNHHIDHIKDFLTNLGDLTYMQLYHKITVLKVRSPNYKNPSHEQQENKNIRTPT